MPTNHVFRTFRAQLAAPTDALAPALTDTAEHATLKDNPSWEKALSLLSLCTCDSEIISFLRNKPETAFREMYKSTSPHLFMAFLWALSQEKPLEEALSTEEALAICRLLNSHRAPYYPRYLVSSRLFSPAVFESVLQQLEAPEMSLKPGHTQQQRIDAITPYFPGGSTLVDIGCGKATYLRILGERYFSAIGFEKDEATRKEAEYVLRRQRVTQAKIFPSFDTARQIPRGAHVLMTEVMEHMPLPAAESILFHLGQSSAQRIVLSAPNRLFNKNYGLVPGTFRHWDHHWEPDESEFQKTIHKAFGKQWVCTLSGIGDSVNGVSATLLCVAEQPRIKSLW